MHEIAEKDRAVTNIFSTLLLSVNKAVNEDYNVKSVISIFPEVKTKFQGEIQTLEDEVQRLEIELERSNREKPDRRESIVRPKVNGPGEILIYTNNFERGHHKPKFVRFTIFFDRKLRFSTGNGVLIGNNVFSPPEVIFLTGNDVFRPEMMFFDRK